MEDVTRRNADFLVGPDLFLTETATGEFSLKANEYLTNEVEITPTSTNQRIESYKDNPKFLKLKELIKNFDYKTNLSVVKPATKERAKSAAKWLQDERRKVKYSSFNFDLYLYFW
jgi:hypothetical protein